MPLPYPIDAPIIMKTTPLVNLSSARPDGQKLTYYLTRRQFDRTVGLWYDGYTGKRGWRVLGVPCFPVCKKMFAITNYSASFHHRRPGETDPQGSPYLSNIAVFFDPGVGNLVLNSGDGTRFEQVAGGVTMPIFLDIVRGDFVRLQSGYPGVPDDWFEIINIAREVHFPQNPKMTLALQRYVR